jgi:hypothetical protein
MSPDAATPEPEPDSAPEPDVPPPAPRFDVEPYRPRGSAPVLGTVLLFAGLTAVAVGVGLVVGLIRIRFYPVLLFPVLAGLLLGAAGAGLVRLFKVRSLAILLAAALTGGVATIAASHIVSYREYLSAIEHEDPAALALIQQRGFNFLGYVDTVEAVDGVHIGKPPPNGVNLGYYGSYVYWGTEALVVAAAAFALMRLAARSPFCARCATWKRRQVVGALDTPFPDRGLQGLREGEVHRLLRKAAPAGGEGLFLKVSSCPRCRAAAPADVALELHVKDAKGHVETKELAHYTYPGDVLRFLDGPANPS